jgi:hypothetical protein
VKDPDYERQTHSRCARRDRALLVKTVQKGDSPRPVKAGRKPPEVFVDKGPDGTTDIWAIIIRPANFDPSSSGSAVHADARGQNALGGGNDPPAPFGEQERFDFFVRHLLGAKPPVRSSVGDTPSPAGR